MENHDVIIIGAGPAGLSTALRLRELGVKDVVVLERESKAGGVPRHCGHFGFGWGKPSPFDEWAKVCNAHSGCSRWH